MIRLKRIYEPASSDDGTRILVDRLWPRGVSKEKAQLDLWLKDVAPSTALRTWFGHDPAKWQEFRKRYTKELTAHPAAVATLQEKIRHGTVTLLYGARDTEHNEAVVLKDYLEKH